MPSAQDDRISRFPVPDPDTLPDDLRERMESDRKRAGFVPNVYRAYGYKPEHFRAFFHHYDALMKGESGLSREEREMIAVAVSRVNACTYCTVAHGAALRVASKSPYLADQIAANYRTAEVTPRQRAMLDFAVKVAEQSAAVGEDDFARLRPHGFADADIWDIGAVAAFFSLSNRMANVAGLRPNREFYGMGREP
jgi:uncharacterized peroxidase-related enzyme